MHSNSTNIDAAKINISDLQAIIFDFDGTLVDSEPVWKSTFFDLFKKDYGVEVPQKILWENTGGGVDLSVLNISNKLELKMSEAEIESVAQRLHEKMQNNILEYLPLREGVTKVFDLAKANSIQMAVCTASTNELIESYFSKLGMQELFGVVVSTSDSDMQHRKPYPFPYLETLRLLNVEANKTLVIEDSPKGITSSVLAGIDTVAIHNPFLDLTNLENKPKFVVQDFLQVLELFSNE